MHKTAADQTQKCQKYYKMEFQTIGKAFQQLGNALQQDGNYRKLKLATKYMDKENRYSRILYFIFSEPKFDQCHNMYRRSI